MKIGVWGISYWRSNVVIREELVRVLGIIFMNHFTQFSNCVPLFTCNRVEIYFCAKDIKEYLCLLITTIEKNLRKAINPTYYYYFDESCFYHLIKVVSGLDSPIIGETEIQGQVKRAYQNICNQRKLPSLLHLLFQKSLHIGKKLRTEQNFSFFQSSLEKLIFNIIKKKFLNDFLCKRILFVGFSKINKKIFSFLFNKGFSQLHFFSASQQKKILKDKDVIKYKFVSKNILENIQNYNVIIFGSNYKYKIFSDPIFISRLNQEVIIFDLGVPRNFNLNSKQVDIYNMDNLNTLLLSTCSLGSCSSEMLKQHIFLETRKQWSLFMNKIYRSQQLVIAT